MVQVLSTMHFFEVGIFTFYDFMIYLVDSLRITLRVKGTLHWLKSPSRQISIWATYIILIIPPKTQPNEPKQTLSTKKQNFWDSKQEKIEKRVTLCL